MIAFEVRAVDHRDAHVATQIHAVQMSSYAQEARLLGVRDFPPLRRSLNDIQGGAERFWAAFSGARILGAIGVEQGAEGSGANIASLVVDPEFQRNGIGARLLAAVLETFGSGEVTVQTGAKNAPALALYARFGFVELRRWRVGPEGLELVKLKR